MSRRMDIKAIIYDRKDKVLSVGFNSYIKTHPLQARHAQRNQEPSKIFLHAEIHAIARCRQLDRAHRILVTRFDKHGHPQLAKPCKVCQSAIKEAGIKIIDYTM